MQNEPITMEERACPYLGIECQTVCPAWLDDMDDCLFHICLTQVREVFYQAASYLDEKIGIDGVDTLSGLRKIISGQATDDDKAIVRSVITNLLKTGIMHKIPELRIGDLASIFSSVEKVIHFDLGSLFTGPARDEEEEGEEEPLVFTE